MKSIVPVLFVLFLGLFLLECRKEPPKIAPTISISGISDITAQSASTGGNVTADGGAAVTSRGICWSSSNQTPTTSDSKIQNGSGLGSFTSSLVGLTSGVTYFLRAFAMNTIGTSYSDVLTLKTLTMSPFVITTEPSQITSTTAISGGNIPTDGGAPVSSRGVCWSTKEIPTITDSKTTDGTGTGSFNSSITGLSPMTTYFIRAYATNSNGTTYGNQAITKTKEAPFYPISRLDSLSEINKTTSWFNTNQSFTQLFNLQNSQYNGFEKTSNGLIPFIPGTWLESKVINYYWGEVGMYLFTDLTGDGKKDLYTYYLKAPWPTNAHGLNLFSEYERQSSIYDLQVGLTQVRKCVLADINNDHFNEIVLFSSGYDGMPFPGDSIGIFYPRKLQYQYLAKDIGYFHGGATGDINNDGLTDIVAYSGGSAIIPVHPVAYINKGNGIFTLSNNVFKGFAQDDNYYTVELFDVNKDGKLDLLLGRKDLFIIIPQENGEFNRQKAINIPVETGLELMDISFFDYNLDGKLDLLTMSNKDSYNGFQLSLYLNENNNYSNKTSDFFDQFAGLGKNNWIAWIRLFDYDKDGDLDIVGDGLYGDLNNHLIYWRNDRGKFTLVKQ